MLYVDRIEEELVICQDESERMTVIDLAKFDGPVREGDCVVSAGDDRYRVDAAASRDRRKSLAKRLDGLFRRKTR